MSDSLKRLICLFWRFGKLDRPLRAVCERTKAPATGASGASPASSDSTGAGFEELPPESPWVELSRSSWF